MNAPEGPVLIAYDGSDPARAAVRAAAALLRPRQVLVVTVWEPGLAYVSNTAPGSLGMTSAPMVDLGAAQAIEENLHRRAEQVAGEGAELARSLGLEAEPLAVPDEAHPADAILDAAQARHAGIIVLGSRGLGGLRARLEGSTSKGVMKHARCPVLVVHEPDPAGGHG